MMLPDMSRPPRWWWSRTRKYLWWAERGRAFQRDLWELSDHGRYSIHLATIVSNRVTPTETGENRG